MAGVDSRDAEVQEFRLTRAEDHDVGRLDVPMDHSLDVGVVQCLGNAADDAQCLPPLEAPARREAIGQRLPVEVLEGHEEEAALGVATHVVYDDDPGMGEAGGGARLGLEAPLVVLALGLDSEKAPTVLRAMVRPKAGSQASYTTPIVPRPIFLRISYRPIERGISSLPKAEEHSTGCGAPAA